MSLALASACAIVEKPPGGPIDRKPPRLVSVQPDSGAVDLTGRKVLRFRFSEKMDRQKASSWLRLYPDCDVRTTKWHGATEAEVILFDPLPPDTVIVVEMMPGLADAHRVKNPRSRRYPIATAAQIPPGKITGQLVMGDTLLSGAVVELYDVPPDTLEYFQQKVLRRAVSDSAGTYTLSWLPAPGGPWLIRAYFDKDGNLRAGEKEAQRLLPDTLRTTADSPRVGASRLVLFPWDAPGTLTTGPFPAPRWDGAVGAWALAVTEQDTGWAPGPITDRRAALGWLDPATGGRIEDAPPHAVRVIVFVDIDGDSTFSAVPDTLYGLPAAAPDSNAWLLEPWGVTEGVQLDPGLRAEFAVPAIGDSLVYRDPPPVAPPDSLAAAVDDSLQAPEPNGETE